MNDHWQGNTSIRFLNRDKYVDVKVEWISKSPLQVKVLKNSRFFYPPVIGLKTIKFCVYNKVCAISYFNINAAHLLFRA